MSASRERWNSVELEHRPGITTTSTRITTMQVKVSDTDFSLCSSTMRLCDVSSYFTQIIKSRKSKLFSDCVRIYEQAADQSQSDVLLRLSDFPIVQSFPSISTAF